MPVTWPWERRRHRPPPTTVRGARKRTDQLRDQLARIAEQDEETEALLADLRGGPAPEETR